MKLYAVLEDPELRLEAARDLDAIASFKHEVSEIKEIHKIKNVVINNSSGNGIANGRALVEYFPGGRDGYDVLSGIVSLREYSERIVVNDERGVLEVAFNDPKKARDFIHDIADSYDRSL